ncbi:RteC domain-containing protein [Nonlabens sp. SY33080]|uniref:RteC domain-containing protein n=1 Tax=Nonlabens sp. SY33080 TaxID=2719911 RepID=UPI001428CB55|nr:RteC domain-containing protein [Nonlabens sp. SY33080]
MNNPIIDNIIKRFRDEVKLIEKSDLSEFQNIENGIKLSRKCLQDLRVALRTINFDQEEQEIHFFKVQKPFVYSRLKFFAKLYNYLLQKPAGSIKKQRNFIDAEIEKLQANYKRNIDFVKYYRENDTTFDHYYFVRGNDDLSLASDTSHFYTDSEFSTSHDNAMAKIMAYDLLVAHFNKLLAELGQAVPQSNRVNVCTELDLKWTANKTDLVELIYALQASNAIKDGRAGIKDMVTACEQMFNIELGQYYKTYIEIRARKMDRTHFINTLKKQLEKRMIQDDER